MIREQMLIGIAIFIFFTLTLYLVLIRPQIKNLEKHNKMLAGLKMGDKVFTMGGIIGTICGFKGEKIIVIEVSNGIKVEVFKKMIENIYKD
jgi:preprotein translocase subunit YajC